MAGLVILETERLTLREFDEGDVPAFYILGSDPAITRFTGDGGFTSIEHAREVLCTRPLADYRKYGFGRWACVHKKREEVIGFAGLKYLEDLQEVDIGYRLLPAYWGVGLTTEAGRAVLDYGFVQLHLEEIIGLVDPENAASVRVLEKLGLAFDRVMQYQGTDVARYVIHVKKPFRRLLQQGPRADD
jgi:RimJ/RimL family protein N-acetyltransferase